MQNKTGLMDVTQYGIIGDGKTNDTGAIQKLIDEAGLAGGGTLYFPAGIYLSTSLSLRSNITLHLDGGAILRFIDDYTLYPVLKARWEGSDQMSYQPLIYGKGLDNITLTGTGTLDGSGAHWWQLHRERVLTYARPRLIGLEECSDVRIEKIKLINSPAWTVNPVKCTNVTVDGVRIVNPADSPNTDGINPDSCRYVRIANCSIDVGDDCIAIKSGTEDGTECIPCENIAITNCTMLHGHGGVVIGSEMSGGIKNVVISNCVFEGTDRGIRIKSRRGRGGVIEDIRVSNIIMKQVFSPIVMNLYYNCGLQGKDQAFVDYITDKKAHPVTEDTPVYRRIHFSNITATEVSASAAFIYGLPENPIQDISFQDVWIYMAEDAKPAYPAMMNEIEPMTAQGIFCCNVKNALFNQVRVYGCENEPITVKQSEDVVILG